MTHSRPAAATGYRADIDGLRAIAVGLVVLYHAFPELGGGGFIGVDVFFVISGYLITGNIRRELMAGHFTLGNFYSRRLRRIQPALIAVLIGCAIAGWHWMLPAEFARLGKHVLAGALSVANFAFWTESGYFDVQTDLKPLLHLWSLGVEEQFYLVWPLLLMGLHRLRRSAMPTTIALLVISFAINLWLMRGDASSAFYLPHARFWELLAGGALAMREMAKTDTAAARNPVARDALSLAGLAGLAIAAIIINRDSRFPGGWAIAPVAASVMLIAAGPGAFVNRTLLSGRAITLVGALSFSLYLWHWPLLSFARLVLMEEPAPALRLGLVGAALAAAWMSWRWIETPLRFGKSPASRPLALAIACAAMALTGLGLMAGNGFAGRMPDRQVFLATFDDYNYSRTHDLLANERHDCNFYDITEKRPKTAIAPACHTPPVNTRHTVLLWGDSHAQHLSHGLKTALPEGVYLMHVGASGCRPAIDESRADPLGSCNTANRFALDIVRRWHPDIVILAQLDEHDPARLDAIARQLKAEGAGAVIAVGPVPRWKPFLYQVIARKYWPDIPERIATHLEPEVFAEDAKLAARLADDDSLTYVSLVAALCNPQGCRVRVGNDPVEDLVSYDYGHFTLNASDAVVARAIAPVIDRLLQPAAPILP